MINSFHFSDTTPQETSKTSSLIEQEKKYIKVINFFLFGTLSEF
jgi:hypothetical protein